MKFSKQKNELITLCICTIRLETQSPNPDPPAETQFTHIHCKYQQRTQFFPVTSSLQLALVELRELAEDSLLVVRRETHSVIHHLKAEYAHRIHAELRMSDIG